MRKQDTVAAYEQYRVAFPDGMFVDEAGRRIAKLRSAQQETRQTPPPVPIQPPPQSLGREQAAIQFLHAYLRSWSSDNASALADLSRFYAGSLTFYGQPSKFADVYKDKEKFAARWPLRRYSARPDTIAANCEAGGQYCSVTAVVDWSAASPERNSQSRGSARYELGIAFEGRASKIVLESGKVLARD